MRLPFKKMCNVTHFLLDIGPDVIKLPCSKYHSLSVGHRTRCHQITIQTNVQSYSQTDVRCGQIAFQKKCAMCANVTTHLLLVMG